MKALILSLILLISGSINSQIPNHLSDKLKYEFLSKVNNHRSTEKLGEIYSTSQVDEIANQVFKVKGTVESIKILDVLNLEDEWALYDTYQFTISIPDSISKYYTPESLFSKRLDEVLSRTSNKISTEWMTGSNINKDNPYMLGFYLNTSTQNKETVYKIFIISIRNIPMQYKCVESLKN